MTDRQKEILTFINQFINLNGFPPSYRQIGNNFDISSTFGVKRHLDALIKKGYINIDSNSNRSISLTKKSYSLFNENLKQNFLEIPIIGRVAAGYPVLSEENIEGTLVIDSSLIKKDFQYFGLKVKGDSMIDEGIFEGDTVIVKSQNVANNNEIIIAMVNGETTVKKYFKNKSKIELIPANKNYSPITISNQMDFSVIGKVVGVYRYYL